MNNFYKTEKMTDRDGGTIRVWATGNITHLELHFMGDDRPNDFVLSGSDGVTTAKSLIEHLTAFVQFNTTAKPAPATPEPMLAPLNRYELIDYVFLDEVYPGFFKLDNSARRGGAHLLDKNLFKAGQALQDIAVKRGYKAPVVTPTPKVTPAPKAPKSYAELADQNRTIYQHMVRTGSISAREAFDDYSITSATLSRRICDLEINGWFIKRETKLHPISQRRYTRYSLVS